MSYRGFSPIGRDGDWCIDPPDESDPYGAPWDRPPAWTPPPPPPPPPRVAAWMPAVATITHLIDVLVAEPGEFFGHSGGLRSGKIHFEMPHVDWTDGQYVIDTCRHLRTCAEKAQRTDLVELATTVIAHQVAWMEASGFHPVRT